MKAGGRPAAGVPGRQHAQRDAAGHCLAGAHRRRHRFVGRSQPTGVVDAEHRPPGDHPGEDDHPVPGGQDGGAGLPLEVHPAVPRPVPVRRRRERAADHGLAGQGKAPDRLQPGVHDRLGRGRCGDDTGQRHQNEEQDGERRGVDGHSVMLAVPRAGRERPASSVDTCRGCGRRRTGGGATAARYPTARTATRTPAGTA